MNPADGGYVRYDTAGKQCVQKNRTTNLKLVEDARFFERIESAVLGDSAQRLARDLHADVATAATVELGHPDALLLKVGIHSAVHRLGHVATDTALLFSKTGAVDAATLVGHSERDIADSGHNICSITVERCSRAGILHIFWSASSKTMKKRGDKGKFPQKKLNKSY